MLLRSAASRSILRRLYSYVIVARRCVCGRVCVLEIFPGQRRNYFTNRLECSPKLQTNISIKARQLEGGQFETRPGIGSCICWNCG
jgi:hypothetical protein